MIIFTACGELRTQFQGIFEGGTGMNTLRRIDRKTSDADAMRILQGQPVRARLPAVNEDGQPLLRAESHVVWTAR